MDQIDFKILSLLQENARMSVKDIAEEVSLTSPAVSTRIRKLEEAGVIRGYHVTLDTTRLGYQIKAFIYVELRPEKEKDFHSFVRSNPAVLQCHTITGQYSILLKVYFPGTMELDLFIGELQEFGKTNTNIIMSTLVERFGMQ